MADFYYNYDDRGNRINEKSGKTNEYYLRDHTGRELLVYDNNSRLKIANIFDSRLIGRIDVEWDSTYVQGEIGPGHWQFSRTDNRYYYLKDHLGSTRLGEGPSRSQIRITLDENADVASAQDYYPYGEILHS